MGTVREEERSAAINPAIGSIEPSRPQPSQPSIAVLPFMNMSGDPEQDYFADGMTEEIITALARFKNLFVIASNSSFTYRNRPADIKQVARELGVRYVLEGSVRKAADRVRITGQLIVAETGRHIWTERFDRRIEDIFDLQDEISENIVGAVEPEILSAELNRSRGKRPGNLAAYDCVFRAYQHLWILTLEDNNRALDFLRQAVLLEPHYALAYAYASWADLFRVQLTQGGSLRPLLTEALTFAQRAVELDPSDPLIQTIRGAWQLMIERDFDAALLAMRKRFRRIRTRYGFAVATDSGMPCAVSRTARSKCSNAPGASVRTIPVCFSGFQAARSLTSWPDGRRTRSDGPRMHCSSILGI